jgi:hypothetical protein
MTGFWRSYMIIWCWGIIIFGIVLAGAAFEATSTPARLVFALLSSANSPPLVLEGLMPFAIGLQGALSIGWGLTFLCLFQHGAQMPRQIWSGITLGFVAWYVIDSGISIATGMPLNAISNTAVLIPYLIGMLKSGVLTSASGQTLTARA